MTLTATTTSNTTTKTINAQSLVICRVWIGPNNCIGQLYYVLTAKVLVLSQSLVVPLLLLCYAKESCVKRHVIGVYIILKGLS